MTPDQFKKQILRLQSRFGDRAFDNEFAELVWRIVDGMRHDEFVKVVETFIGARSHNKPPLLSEFREQRFNIERHRMEGDKRGPAKILNHPSMRPLGEILSQEFGGGVETAADAFRIAKLRMLKDDDKEGA